jgi:hypothetical protein
VLKMIQHIKDKVIISLNSQEYIRLKEVLIDEDKNKALSFIKDILGKKVKEIERPTCVPVFEASYRPGQKDKFDKNKTESKK